VSLWSWCHWSLWSHYSLDKRCSQFTGVLQALCFGWMGIYIRFQCSEKGYRIWWAGHSLLSYGADVSRGNHFRGLHRDH